MNKIPLIIILLFIISCHNKNTKKTPSQSYIKQVGDNLFKDTKTNSFYYDENDVCHKKELSNPNQSLKLITDNQNNAIKDIDEKSFVSTRAFWYDKKYFFAIKDSPSNIEVKSYPIDSVFSGWYFKNSKYKIRNNNLEYYGQIWESDSILNCNNDPIIKNIDLNDFNVINSDENCSINAYALYKQKFLFHGCWLNINKVPHDLKEKLVRAKKQNNFVQKIKIE